MLDSIPLNKIILESDAPHFVRRNLRGTHPDFGIPGDILLLAEELADRRSILTKDVLSCSARNVAKIYGIVKK